MVIYKNNVRLPLLFYTQQKMEGKEKTNIATAHQIQTTHIFLDNLTHYVVKPKKEMLRLCLICFQDNNIQTFRAASTTMPIINYPTYCEGWYDIICEFTRWCSFLDLCKDKDALISHCLCLTENCTCKNELASTF